MNTYAGIGSRQSPPEILLIMESISKRLSEAGWKLRSGGASGADSAFQRGIQDLPDLINRQEIYLPWNGFNWRLESKPEGIIVPSYSQMVMAEKLARKYHPSFDRLSPKARMLITRNTFQILGLTLNTPVDMVICYTPDGSIGTTTYKTGGTGQAIRMAKDLNIPIYNLGKADHLAKIDEFVHQWCNTSDIVDF